MKYRLWSVSACLLMSLSIFSSQALASEETFFQWHQTNLQLLQGFDYQLGDENRTIVTLEHANGWKYGDFYMFADQIWSNDSHDSTYYYELSPRFSLSKITGQSFSKGIIKDILLSTTLEKPKNTQERYLYGIGVDLKLTGFKFFKTNLYVRDNPDLDKTYQVTLAWHRAFKINNIPFVVEGFADFAGDEGTGKKPHQLIVPRFLVDLGYLIDRQENKLYAGVEWQYWHNKFGVEGVTESAPQLQIKYLF